MVSSLEQEKEGYNAKLLHFRALNDNNKRAERHGHTQSLIFESSSGSDESNDDRVLRNQPLQISSAPWVSRNQALQVSSALSKYDTGSKLGLGKDGDGTDRHRRDKDVELMKERFSKLLLGEDMSGGGKGVSSALALSNAITNLAASIFGEQRKLEPMSPENRVRWKKEIDWLLSVTDYIVEFVPSQQKNKDGTSMEIMTTKQRTDLQMNIPALRKLDAMLVIHTFMEVCLYFPEKYAMKKENADFVGIPYGKKVDTRSFILPEKSHFDCLDNFKDQNEFYYVSKDAGESERGVLRNDDKWWLPTVKVPPNGLSEVSKKWLQFQKDSVNQVLKAAMAINAQVLSEMDIPDNYIESLPKNGRASLGDSIYKSITDEYFDPEQFLLMMDLSSEIQIVDLKNRIEASIVIWNRKMNNKDAKSPWGSGVSFEKRELFEERAETILLLIKQRFPGIAQSALDISKIQYNKDVGHAILESYSRILESLAHTVLSRIEDVLYADSPTQESSLAQYKSKGVGNIRINGPMKFPDAVQEIEELNAADTPTSMTLSDFMGWNLDQGETEMKRRGSEDNLEEIAKDGGDQKPTVKLQLQIPNRFSYIDKLEYVGGQRSPTSRH